MPIFKEIVTKAVVGKGKKYFKNSYSVTTEQIPTTVLGCWVINHKFRGYESNGKIIVDGSYDVNIWYSYDSDSKTGVVTKTVDYSETIGVKAKDESLKEDKDIVVRILKQPSCSNVTLKNGSIDYEIEKELGVEIVGDTKVKIAIEEDEEPWEIVEEEVTDEEIEQSVTENFL